MRLGMGHSDLVRHVDHHVDDRRGQGVAVVFSEVGAFLVGIPSVVFLGESIPRSIAVLEHLPREVIRGLSSNRRIHRLDLAAGVEDLSDDVVEVVASGRSVGGPCIDLRRVIEILTVGLTAIPVQSIVLSEIGVVGVAAEDLPV